MRRCILAACTFGVALLMLPISPAHGEETSPLTVVSDAGGNKVFTFSGEIHEGDEYITADNALYRITSVSSGIAQAERIGDEIMPDVSWLDAGASKAVFSCTGKDTGEQPKKMIAMYVTHSDESYIPTDGTESINGQGGIYDVARAFRDELQSLGIDVVFDESTHLPHDSGAYRRSRQTAQRLLKHMPDAIIDIHRDGIPDQTEYTCTIEGEPASQVRLLVGRSNQNSAVNREFAKEIKAVADKLYPGLIKDIFIGKGNYNQDLSPNAILLEFGTHTLSKDRALESTQLMANVVSNTLYGAQTGSLRTADQPEVVSQEKNKKASTSSILLILLAIIVIALFAFAQTGNGKAVKNKLGRNLSEITGGIVGKKPDSRK